MAKLGTNGGMNRCIVAAIESGNVVTTSGKYFVFDMTEETALSAGLIKGTSGKTITLTSYANNPALDTFLKTYASDAIETPDSIRFEDGEEYVATAAATVGLFIGVLGGTQSGKIQTVYGSGALSDGDISQKYNTPTTRNMTFTTQSWNGAADLVIPSGFWDLFKKADGTTKILKTTTPSPELPVELEIGKASEVIWLEAL